MSGIQGFPPVSGMKPRTAKSSVYSGFTSTTQTQLFSYSSGPGRVISIVISTTGSNNPGTFVVNIDGTDIITSFGSNNSTISVDMNFKNSFAIKATAGSNTTYSVTIYYETE